MAYFYKDRNQYFIKPYTPAEYDTGVILPDADISSDRIARQQAMLDEMNQRYQNAALLQPTQTPKGREGNNLLQNIGQDFLDIVEGATGLAAHPVDYLVKPLGEEVANIGGSIVEGWNNPAINQVTGTNPKILSRAYGAVSGGVSKAATDFIDFMISNYDITTQDLYDALVSGTGDKKELVNTAIKAAKEKPLFTALDIASIVIPVLKAIRGASPAAKVSKAGTRTTEQIAKEVSNMSPAERVATQINMSGAEVNKNANKFLDKTESIKKNYKPEDIKEAVKAHLTGREAPEINKQLLKDVGESLESYDNMLTQENKYAESLSKEDKFAIADAQATQFKEGEMAGSISEPSEYIKQAAANGEKIAQDMVREWELSKNPRSFDEIKRERQPYYDLIKNEGFESLDNLAKEGDLVAQDIIKNKTQFDKGYLKIVPMAEITNIDKSGMINREGRTFAGRASDRMYGTASVDQIVDSYFMKPNEWIDNKVTGIIEKEAIGEMLTKGTLGNAPLVTEKTKKVVYIDPTLSKLDTIVETATDKATNANTLAVDKKLLGELKGQMDLMKGGNNPFSEGILSDAFQVKKGVDLASGGYLAGNAQTALYNAFLNAGLNPIGFARDFIDAWRSNNALIKRANAYRRLQPLERRIKNPILKAWTKGTFSDAVSNTLNYIDTKIQNMAAEMAAHRNLRDRNIGFNKRVDFLENSDKLTLAQISDDLQTVALMNKTKTLLPRQLHKVAAIGNPFWRWTDTALQSTMYMMWKHPSATNFIWNKVMGNYMFDKEEQNRMNLGVQSNKPFVSYRYNPETKTLQEVSAEFMPVMNSVKFFGEAAEAIKEGDGAALVQRVGLAGIPFIGATTNAIMGKDKYGRPLINAKINDGGMSIDYRSGERYVMTPEGWKANNQGDVGEVIGTLVNEATGSLKFFNRAIAPAVTEASNLLTGSKNAYYQPYQYTPFGTIGQAGIDPQSGLANPRKASNLLQVEDYLLGRYSRDYDPDYEARADLPMGKQQSRQLMRGVARYQNRTQDLLRARGGGY